MANLILFNRLVWYNADYKKERSMSRLKNFRVDLHQIPETAFEEFKTHAYLVEILEGLGFNTHTYLETDVIVYIDRGADTTLAFRSDIDGLPQDEYTDSTYASKHTGRMHACGHDGHMAMLLELAHALKEHVANLTVNVLLIFQPAEEKIGGAKKLIEAGLFTDYPVDYIFGIHVYPYLNEGIVASRPGFLMAQANELTITFNGKGSHGAMPELGIDANHMASLFLSRVYQKIATLNASSRVICTFGKIQGGTVKNIIAEQASLEGTMRTFTPADYHAVESVLQQEKTAIEAEFKGNVDVHIHDGYLPVNNDVQLYDQFRRALEGFTYHELSEALLIGEDFSFYQREVPGVFFFIGTKNESKGYVHSLHSSHFNFDEAALETGVKAYIKIIEHIQKGSLI